jgi:hypothetical protein
MSVAIWMEWKGLDVIHSIVLEIAWYGLLTCWTPQPEGQSLPKAAVLSSFRSLKLTEDMTNCSLY